MSKPEAIGHGIDMIGYIAIVLASSAFVSVCAVGFIDWIKRHRI